MNTRRLTMYSAVFAAASWSVASAQLPEGNVYTLHSEAKGPCPSLDWHILVQKNGILTAMITWDDMRTMAKATGVVDQKDHTFSMIATELSGGTRRAKIEGQIDDKGWVVAKIDGPNMKCDAVIVPLHTVQPSMK